jgi:hypothetical protein
MKVVWGNSVAAVETVVHQVYVVIQEFAQNLAVIAHQITIAVMDTTVAQAPGMVNVVPAVLEKLVW